MFFAVKIPEVTQKSVFFLFTNMYYFIENDFPYFVNPICTFFLSVLPPSCKTLGQGFSYQLLWCIFCILCDINVKKYFIYIYNYILFPFIFLSNFFLSHSPSNFAKTKLSLKLINWLQNLHYHPNTKTYSPSKCMGTHFPQCP